jgi:hypothetical protein
MNPDNFAAKAEQQECLAAAPGAQAARLVVVNARKPDEIAGALAEAQRLRVDSYMAASDPLILDRRGEIVAWGQAHGLAGVGFVRQFATSGALISYGPSIVWMYRQAGRYSRRDPQGREAGAASRRAADGLRARRQPEDRRRARA